MTTVTPDSPLPVRAYDLAANRAGYLQSVVLLLFRLAWGWEAYLSGYRHLHNVSDTVDFFRELHVPMPTFSVYVSGLTELVGGLLLMLGVATRLVAIPFVFNFIIAVATAGSDKVKQALFGGDHFKRYNAGHLGGLEAVIDDTAFPFLMTGLLMLAFGPGRISIDYLLRRTVWRRYTPLPDDPRRGFETQPPPVQTP